MSHTIMFESVYMLIPKLKRQLSPELVEELDVILELYERKVDNLAEEVVELKMEIDDMIIELREAEERAWDCEH